ncbi:Hexuronate transporter, putative [Perkinsus marinus ATCC 50983]|uniref:Lysosomal dipeptide transporter MFSD1 n=1 Tax=Perkinsus marinus (strain ATCC 50983 / TXsc) TaxID=423536 RepID=C5KRU4_PERM5|nr:Hexuronate transporter, putative [Perkinsus marinus ATCC 50983]EER12785.1 Hexuronate transporter, putative [Perkinsus marinus ATCC 50983]|eukprot:XP_002780990.1 Hexuronate transporter, putative [Perkinsus marinus ATCC 50983]
MASPRRASDIRRRWASQLTKACEADDWGQILEAQEGYRKLAIDMAATRGHLAVSSTDQEITRKIILCLSARLEILSKSGVRSGHLGITIADLKSLEPGRFELLVIQNTPSYSLVILYLFLPAAASPYAAADKFPVSATKFREASPIIKDDTAGDTVDYAQRDVSDFHQSHAALTEVVDPDQTVVCSVDTHISRERRVNHVLFEERVYLAVSLEQMQRTNSAIFFEFKHYKPKKKKVSTRCWSFMELQELKPDEETVLEIYHKPTDLRKRKLKLHSVKKLLSPAMSDTIRDLDGPGRPHTQSGTAMEAEYFLQESEGPSQGQHEAARLHRDSQERFENGDFEESLLAKDQSYRNGPVRFIVLILQSLVLMGLTYNYDMCSATRNVLVERLGISDTGYGVISGVYAYPNVILPLFGGLLIDLVGVQRSMIFFVLINFSGTVVYALGLHMRSFTVLVVGRAIFGMGGESLNVANSTIMTHWFRGKELAFALGCSLTLSRLGSVLVLNTQPMFVRNWGVVIGAMAGVCMAGVTSAVLTCVFDRQANSHDKANHIAGAEEDTKSGDRGVQLSDVKSFGKMFWCLALSCVFTYMSIFPFYQVVAPAYLQSDAHFGFDLKTTNAINSIPTMLGAVLSPFMSIYIDRRGQRPKLMVWASALLLITNVSLMVFPRCPHCTSVAFFFVLMGISICLYGAVIWACIPFTVPPRSVGAAFGLTFALQNCGQAIAPSILEFLHQESGDFIWPFGCLALWAAIGLGISLYLKRIDRSTQTGLFLPCPEKLAEQLACSPVYYYDSPTTEAIATAMPNAPTAAVVMPEVYVRRVQGYLSSPRSNMQFRRAYYSRLGLGHS